MKKLIIILLLFSFCFGMSNEEYKKSIKIYQDYLIKQYERKKIKNNLLKSFLGIGIGSVISTSLIFYFKDK